MKRFILCLTGKLTLFILLLSPQMVSAEGSYWGDTGVLEIPNGRVINDGDLRFTFSYAYPYISYAGTFGFFPFLELNARLVEMRHLPKSESPAWKGYGYLKSRAPDVKVQIISEEKWWPSLAVGARDFTGTKVFESKYIAASKNYGPLDITVGYGEDRLKGLFGGIEWEINPKLSFLAEHDPSETLANSSEKIDYHYNYGIRWRPWQWLNVGLSHQRDKEFGFYLSINYPLGKPLKPQKPDYPFVGPLDYSPLVFSGINSRLSKIREYLIKEGFSQVSVTLSSNLSELYVEYHNNRYLSQTKALGRVLRVVCTQIPPYVEYVHIIIKSARIPMVHVSLVPRDFIDLLNGKISTGEMLKRTRITTVIPEYGEPEWEDDITVEEEELLGFTYGFKPIGVETYLNDPSGFFKARIGPTIRLRKELSKGLTVQSKVRFPVYSNVKTTMGPISEEPIRSDIVDYLENTGVVIQNALLNYYFRFGDTSFGRMSAGYLELQFAGASLEYLRVFGSGRFGLGKEFTWAKKRSADSLLNLEDFETVSPRLKGYLFIPELDSTFQVQFGKFLAGDRGARFELTRYIRGASVSLWYSETDTRNFTGPNRNYSDKGVAITIPWNVFSEYERRGSFGHALPEWSRDVGQVVREPYSLYSFIREFLPVQIMDEWEKVIE